MFNSNEIYKVKEIKPLLGNYHKLPTEIKVDVDRALESELMDGTMYLFIALHYHHGFSLMTSAKYMGLSLKEVMALNEEVLECVEAVMNGYRAAKRKQKNKHSCQTTSCSPIGWSALLLEQAISPFDVDHFDDLLLERDELGREVLNQRIYGMPAHIKDELFGTEYDATVYTERPVDEKADGFELDRFLVDERHNNNVRSIHDGE